MSGRAGLTSTAVLAVVAAMFVAWPSLQAAQTGAGAKARAAAPAVPKRTVRAAGEANPQAAAVTEAVKATAQSFADAFNQHDAKAVAGLWTEDGEYIDESGEKFVGRNEIERQYTAFFAAYPTAKLTVVVDSVRPVGASAAIEAGHTELAADGKTAVSSARYTAVHVKLDDHWQMTTVRDERITTAPSVSQMQDLAWLIGSWQAEQSGGKVQVDCRWIAENQFIERKFSASRGDQVIASGVQIIGWNAGAQAVQSWTFTSDGAHATGLWVPRRGGWVIENVGMLSDGTPTTAINYFVKLNDNTLVWKSVERSAGGLPLADAEEVALTRVTTPSK